MPGTLTIDTTATFQAVLLMASGPKLKFGSTEQDISARGERKWDVQAAVTYHAEPGMKPVSEVIAVTVTGPPPTRARRSRPAPRSCSTRCGSASPCPRPARTAAASAAAAPGTRPPMCTRPTSPARPRPTRPHNPFKPPGQVTDRRWPGRALHPEVTVPFLVLPVVVMAHRSLARRPRARARASSLYRPAADLIRFALASPSCPPALPRHDPRPAPLALAVPVHRPRPARTRAKNRPAAESRALVLVLLVHDLAAAGAAARHRDCRADREDPLPAREALAAHRLRLAMPRSRPRRAPAARKSRSKPPHIADYWRSVRVGVTQAAPGRLIVRALRTDPLAEPFGPEPCPPGTFEPHQPDRALRRPRRLR